MQRTLRTASQACWIGVRHTRTAAAELLPAAIIARRYRSNGG